MDPSIQELYVQEYVSAMQEICEEHWENVHTYQENDNKLTNGIYYANEYYHALKKTNNFAKLGFLVRNDAFYNGWASSEYLYRS